MPVYKDKQTGQAVDLPEDQGNLGLANGSLGVYLVDPQNNPMSVDVKDYHDYQKQGYRPPSPEELQGLLDYSKHDTLGSQIQTGLEAAGRASTFGLSDMILQGAGQTAKDIRQRQKVNPGSELMGTIAGLAGPAAVTALTGVPLPSEAEALTAIGKAAEGAIFGGEVAQDASALTRAGRTAARFGAENATFTAGDELAKKIDDDPEAGAGAALAHITMSGLVGGALGAGGSGSKSLWNATVGAKLSPYLKGLSNAATKGVDATNVNGALPDMMLDAGQGLPVSEEWQANFPAQKGVLEGNPMAVEMHHGQLLSNKPSAIAYKEESKKALQAVDDEWFGNLGFNEENKPTSDAVNKYSRGKEAIEDITKSTKDSYEPIKKGYATFEEPASKIPLYPASRQGFEDAVNDANVKYNWSNSTETPRIKLLNELNKNIGRQKNMAQLKQYSQEFLGRVWKQSEQDPSLKDFYFKMREIFDNTMDTQIENYTAENAPELIEKYKSLRGAYKEHMAATRETADNLKLGHIKGTEDFLSKLEDAGEENIYNRLDMDKNVSGMDHIKTRYPGLADKAKNWQLSDLVARSNAKGEFNLKNAVNKLEKMSPQGRANLVSDEAYQDAIAKLRMKDAMPTSRNASGSGIVSSDKWSPFIAAKIGAFLGAAVGHPYLGAMVGPVMNSFVADTPAAVRYGLMKAIGSGSADIIPSSLKSAIEFATNVDKGTKKIQKAVGYLFSNELGKISADKISDKDRKKLEAAAKLYQTDPTKFIDSADELGTYLPAQASAYGSSIATAMSLIDSSKPRNKTNGMFDRETKPGKLDKAIHDRTMQLINDPAAVIHSIGNGTLTQRDISTIKSVHPGTYKVISNEITKELIDHKSRGNKLPYKQRLTMGMFLGQPLDSTMNATAIAMNQPKPEQQAQQQQQHQLGGSKKSLNKLPGIYETSAQNREQQRSIRK